MAALIGFLHPVASGRIDFRRIAESRTSRYLSTLTAIGAMAGVLPCEASGVAERAPERAAVAAAVQNTLATTTRLAQANAFIMYTRRWTSRFKVFI